MPNTIKLLLLFLLIDFCNPQNLMTKKNQKKNRAKSVYSSEKTTVWYVDTPWIRLTFVFLVWFYLASTNQHDFCLIIHIFCAFLPQKSVSSSGPSYQNCSKYFCKLFLFDRPKMLLWLWPKFLGLSIFILSVKIKFMHRNLIWENSA